MDSIVVPMWAPLLNGLTAISAAIASVDLVWWPYVGVLIFLAVRRAMSCPMEALDVA
jgi:hypothetical protein